MFKVSCIQKYFQPLQAPGHALADPQPIFASKQRLMTVKVNFKLSQTILEISGKSEGCRLEQQVIDSLPRLGPLCRYLEVEPVQAFLFANIFSLSFTEKTVSIHQLAEHYDCHPLKIAEYHDDFERLLEKGLLDKKSILPSFFSDIVKESFAVPDHITEAIIKNRLYYSSYHQSHFAMPCYPTNEVLKRKNGLFARKYQRKRRNGSRPQKHRFTLCL